MPLRFKKFVFLNWFTQNPKLTTALFFAILIAVMSLITHQRYELIQKGREKSIALMLDNVVKRLSQLLDNSQNIALTIALTLDQEGNAHNFEEIAAEILEANPTIRVLELVRNGKITHIYPLKGNEEALGLDLFKTTTNNNLAAQKAIALRTMYFQGPFKLIQGDIAVVGRLPMYRDKKFWGFSAVVINLDSLLNAAGIDNKHEYYKFQFSKFNTVTGKQQFFMNDGVMDFNGTFRVRTVEEGDWKIYLTDTRSTFADSQLISLLLFGILLSTLCSMLLFRVLQKQLQLYSFVDKQRQELEAAEGKYKIIFDKAAVGIGRIDSVTGEFLETNAFLCELLGYTAEELRRKKIKTLIHEDDLLEDAKEFKRLLAGEIREFSLVRRYLTKNEGVIWANAIVSPLWDKAEKPSHHLVIVHDISKQVAHETELIASQKNIEELINSIEGIVWQASIDQNYSNTFISSKVYEILGYTQEECTTTANFLLDHIYEEDKQGVLDYISKKLFTKRHHVYEYRMVAKDGSLIWIRDSLSIEPSLDSPEKLRGIMINITSAKEAEETLQKSFDLVNEQNKRLLNFSYIVSHNLRSHASNIDGITSLISNADSDEERDQMIELLTKVVANLNDTLYNLNNIVNIRTSINLVREQLNLHEYLNNAIHTQEAQILNMKAEIYNEVPNDVFVFFNKAYLESVLLNLISNAIRYSHPARTPIITITCQATEMGHTLSIKDNGVGIDLKKNGNKLFGLNQTFHGNSGARGFGLFITKNQIEAMGYEIEVESELDKGTTFKVLFK